MTEFDRLARFYDAEYDGFHADLAMYLGFAERVGSPILDLGCGTGRVLIRLAQAGFQVTGLDVSGAMLELARRKVAAQGLEQYVHLVQADMRDFALDQQFHMALCAINSFMHLETQIDQLVALRCWRRHLRPGGLLILDLFPPNPELLADEHGCLIVQRTWTEPDTGITVIKQYTRHVDLAEQVVHVQFLFDEVLPDGTWRRTLVPFAMRYLGRFEAELLLEKAGYAVEAIYGSWELDPFESDSDRMILVARRRED